MAFLYGLSLLIGLAIGSFINVIVARSRTGEKVTLGRSRCPYCRTRLRWYDLLPLVSFLWLHGRCRYCQKKISWQYPIVEAVTGAGFFLLTLLFADNFILGGWLIVLFSLLVLIASYDARYLVIPDWAVALLLGWVVSGQLIFQRGTIGMSVIAGLALASFFLLLFSISRGRWLGGGDVKLAAVLGFWVGWPAVLVLFGAAYITGGLSAALALTLGWAKPKSQIAFGPFLILGALVAFLWGEEIIQWYLKDLL